MHQAIAKEIKRAHGTLLSSTDPVEIRGAQRVLAALRAVLVYPYEQTAGDTDPPKELLVYLEP